MSQGIYLAVSYASYMSMRRDGFAEHYLTDAGVELLKVRAL